MKTLYNYIEQGNFTARNIDLPNKVKCKVRKRNRHEPTIDYSYRDKKNV